MSVFLFILSVSALTSDSFFLYYLNIFRDALLGLAMHLVSISRLTVADANMFGKVRAVFKYYITNSQFAQKYS